MELKGKEIRLRNMAMRAKRIGANIDISTKNGFTVSITGKLNTN